MAVVLIVLCAFFAYGHAGYIYPRPTTPFELPTNVNTVKQQNVVEDSSHLPESTVSFSLPFEDYNYLKHHKLEYHNTPFNDPQALNAHESQKNKLEDSYLDSAVLQKLVGQSGSTHAAILGTEHEEASLVNQYIISKENLEAAKNILQQTEPIIHNDEIKTPDEAPITNPLISTIDVQSLIQSTVPEIGNTFANEPERARNIFEPNVIRHISFHVPPSDMEEPHSHIPEPPKKTYKIIFIKVPAQDSSNTAQIQQALYDRIVPVEEKTLIYVLVKKSEPVEMLPPPPPTPSEHEVLFVKYKDNRINAPLPVAENFVQERSVLNEAVILQPGLVKGQR